MMANVTFAGVGVLSKRLDTRPRNSAAAQACRELQTGAQSRQNRALSWEYRIKRTEFRITGHEGG